MVAAKDGSTWGGSVSQTLLCLSLDSSFLPLLLLLHHGRSYLVLRYDTGLLLLLLLLLLFTRCAGKHDEGEGSAADSLFSLVVFVFICTGSVCFADDDDVVVVFLLLICFVFLLFL